MAQSIDQRQALRKQLRQRRRALSSTAQIMAAQQLFLKISRNILFRRARTILFYWPNDGEISPLPLMHQALKQNKICYLPVIKTKTLALQGQRYQRGDRLRRNRFGIPEPLAQTSKVFIGALDLLLIPLVGFDQQGHRLGMGGGFYDRSLESLRHCRRPLRIGLAHSLQKVAHLDSAPWDIPLHGLCTEKQFYLFI